MAIDTDFIQFLDKPSGVYRLTKDASTINTVGAAATTPLIIGFSKKGLFNTPVYCPDTEFFASVFGDVDRTLERKGSWFHRTAKELLETGPIIVLNLFNLKNETPANINTTSLTDTNYDLTEYSALSVGSSFKSTGKRNQVYSRFFNTDKFWYADDEQLNEFASVGNTDSLLSFVNVSQKPLTVLTRKSTTTGYNVTLAEFYPSDEIPEYLNKTDYLSDYFIDVIVLSGDYTDYAKLSIDPILGQYFDKDNGLIKSQLEDFLRERTVTTQAIYTGSLIPNFIDQNGLVLDITSIINQDTSRTGLVASVNQDILDAENVSGTKFDLIGHNVFSAYTGTNNIDLNYLSYEGKLIEESSIVGLRTSELSLYFALNTTPNSNIKTPVLTIPATTTDNAMLKLFGKISNEGIATNNNLTLNITNDNSTVLEMKFFVDKAEINGTNAIITFKDVDLTGTTIDNTTELNPKVSATPPTSLITGLNASLLNPVLAITGASKESLILTLDNTATGPLEMIYSKGIANKISTSDVLTGVFLTDGTTTASFDLTVNSVTVENNIVKIQFTVPNYAGSSLVPANVVLAATNTGAVTYSVSTYELVTDTNKFTNLVPSIDQSLAPNSNELIVDDVTFGLNDKETVEIGKYMLSEINAVTNKSRLTRIKQVVKLPTNKFKIVTEGPIYLLNNVAIYSKGLHEYFDHYKMTSLFGFRVKDRMLPNNTNSRMNEIYNVLHNTNIYRTLIDKKAITFRYVVDTFNHGIEASSKSILTKLCKDRENAFAILNAPSIKEFSESQDPTFTDIATASDPKPSLDARYIPQGGNLQANPTFIYSLPSEKDGASYGAFYGPNVLLRERGKTISAPPAMYVAKNFVNKHINFRPWSIIAGTRRGVISGKNVASLEYGFDDVERGYLENFGINPIVFERGTGLVITSNSTAKQSIKSSLSQINGTEVLIYIQDRVAEVLKQYVWEFNTPELRLEVKTIVDQELEQIKIDGGIFDYVNIMDNSNNTGETIDNLLGIIDSHIEVAKGLAKAIHRTTIHKTGTIATGII